MTIIKTLENQDVTLKISGRLDTVTSPQLQLEVLPAFDEAKVIKLDFSDLVYVSSAGLRVLLMAQKTAKAKDATLELCNVSQDVMEVLDMTGFSAILTIIPA